MPEIKHSISIDAPRERILPLVASGSGFTRWWAADVTEDDSTGIVEAAFFNRATVYRLKPVPSSNSGTTEWLCETGQEWAGTKLLFELAEASGTTRIHFTHANWKAETDYFAACTKVWGELMVRLKAAAEGKGIGPFFPKDGLAS